MACAVVVLAPGFEEIEALAPIDVLRRAGVTVIVAGLDGRRVEAAHGVVIEADRTLAEVRETPDAVVLPGGMPGSENLGRSEAVAALVRKVLAAGGTVAAICAAPALALGRFGVLDGRRVTCYPGCEGQLPPAAVFVAEPVVSDGPILTSRGPGTALAFSLALAERLAGVETADRLRRGMIAS